MFYVRALFPSERIPLLWGKEELRAVGISRREWLRRGGMDQVDAPCGGLTANDRRLVAS